MLRRPPTLAWIVVVLAFSGCQSKQQSSANTATTQRAAADTTPAVRPSLKIVARPPDAFYDPPASISAEPGSLLRSEAIQNVILPQGMRAWRILYATTIDDKTPALAVAMVFAPREMPVLPRPVIAWAHGTLGLMQKCMPSLLTAPSEGIPARDKIVGQGWVVVATDYPYTEKGGPHPYLMGEAEGRSALDAVRAAYHMQELTLDRRHTLVWGHSQGGHAALWAGIIAPRYAPELKIAGVVAIAPAADIMNIIRTNPAGEKRLGPYIAMAYSRFYPDIKFEEAIRPVALDASRQIVNLCGFIPPEDSQQIHALAESFQGGALAIDTNAALVARIEQNAASGAIAAPLVVVQGLADVVVPPASTEAYVDARCAAGQPVEYWTFADLDHISIVAPGSALTEVLFAWTQARLKDEPQPAGCSKQTF